MDKADEIVKNDADKRALNFSFEIHEDVSSDLTLPIEEDDDAKSTTDDGNKAASNKFHIVKKDMLQTV